MMIPFKTVIDKLFIVIHPATYKLMVTRGSIVIVTDVTQS